MGADVNAKPFRLVEGFDSISSGSFWSLQAQNLGRLDLYVLRGCTALLVAVPQSPPILGTRG